eukprot:COSAG05_NODE_410_length_10109_cov_29.470430_7_plen_104_part_00
MLMLPILILMQSLAVNTRTKKAAAAPKQKSAHKISKKKGSGNSDRPSRAAMRAGGKAATKETVASPTQVYAQLLTKDKSRIGADCGNTHLLVSATVMPGIRYT